MIRYSVLLFLFFILFSLLVVHSTFAQTEPATRFITSQWTMDDGLPQSSVNDIIQTRDGYLWLATFGGLARFNGESFTVFNRSNTKKLKSDRVLNLYEDRVGAIWCSTEGGVFSLRNGTFRSYTIVDDTHTYSPLMMEEDSRGVLWISADGKPYRFRDSLFIPVPVLKDPALAKAAVNDRRGIWMAHRLELLRTLGDSIVLIKDFSSELKYPIQLAIEFPRNSGQIWLASTGEGIIRYADGVIRKYTTEQGLPSNFMKDLYIDRSGNLLVMGFGGISKLEGDRFVPIRTISGSADVEINTIIQDAEGSYWAGAPSQGLFRLRRAMITMIDEMSGMSEGKMLSLVHRKDGTFLFGTNCGGVYEWNGKKAMYSSLNAKLPNLCVWSIFEDSRKNLWIGSRNLTRFDQQYNNRMVFDSTRGFDGLGIFAVTEDSRGNIWIGCLNGLFKYDGKTFRKYQKAEGLTGGDVRALYEDASGTMWIGTSNGLFTWKNDSIESVRLTLKKGKNEVLSTYIRAIYQDGSGTMWFGSYGGGILRLQDGEFSAITTNEGMFDNIVSHIEEDERGYFWMGSNRGLVRVSKEELNRVADGMQTSVQPSVFGTSEGMKSPETNGGFQPSIARDTTGRLYVPTVNGIVVVATRQVQKNSIPPPVVIEKVLSKAGNFLSASEVSLAYDSASVQIEYTALSFIDPKKVRFKYRLIGFDKDWIDAGNRRTAYYTSIPPGAHTFQVIAGNNNGVWNTIGASIPITVLPPFWMTWWFRTLVVLFFLISGPSIYYIRVSQLKKEKQSQLRFAEQLIESQERERRRIAMDLHDGLGQQILIIKNRVDMALKSAANPEETIAQLREIAVSTQSSLNDVRAISHGLRPVHLEQFGLRETLLHLCDQVRQTSPLECVHHVDEIDGLIPSDKEINFFRIIQEGINNILKHSGATQASFMIRRSDSLITASLWDNGKGFDISGTIEGLGLTGIRERAKLLGGTCEVKSHPGGGTTVLITLPVQKL